MAAWYISRVNSRFCKLMYYVCVFSMVVPFQMVMFTLAKTADTLKLNTPWTIPVIYLGFGAGLAVFMFSGFIKSIPLEIEEAAAIDGCGPIRTFFFVGRFFRFRRGKSGQSGREKDRLESENNHYRFSRRNFRREHDLGKPHQRRARSY